MINTYDGESRTSVIDVEGEDKLHSAVVQELRKQQSLGDLKRLKVIARMKDGQPHHSVSSIPTGQNSDAAVIHAKELAREMEDRIRQVERASAKEEARLLQIHKNGAENLREGYAKLSIYKMRSVLSESDTIIRRKYFRKLHAYLFSIRTKKGLNSKSPSMTETLKCMLHSEMKSVKNDLISAIENHSLKSPASTFATEQEFRSVRRASNPTIYRKRRPLHYTESSTEEEFLSRRCSVEPFVESRLSQSPLVLNTTPERIICVTPPNTLQSPTRQSAKRQLFSGEDNYECGGRLLTSTVPQQRDSYQNDQSHQCSIRRGCSESSSPKTVIVCGHCCGLVIQNECYCLKGSESERFYSGGDNRSLNPIHSSDSYHTAASEGSIQGGLTDSTEGSQQGNQLTSDTVSYNIPIRSRNHSRRTRSCRCLSPPPPVSSFRLTQHTRSSHNKFLCNAHPGSDIHYERSNKIVRSKSRVRNFSEPATHLLVVTCECVGGDTAALYSVKTKQIQECAIRGSSRAPLVDTILRISRKWKMKLSQTAICVVSGIGSQERANHRSLIDGGIAVWGARTVCHRGRQIGKNVNQVIISVVEDLIPGLRNNDKTGWSIQNRVSFL